MEFPQFISHAPAKAIISGEHAVVYKAPGLVTALDARMYCTFSPPKNPQNDMISFVSHLQESGFKVSISLAALLNYRRFCDEAVAAKYSLSADEFTKFMYELSTDETKFTSDISDISSYLISFFSDNFIRELFNTDEKNSENVSTVKFTYEAYINGVLDPTFSEASISFRATLVFFFMYLYFARAPCPLIVDVRSAVPIGAGLGSSAALCVSLSGGFYALKNMLQCDNYLPENVTNKEIEQKDDTILPSLDLELVNSWSRLGEEITHGSTVSGIDNTVSTFGGFIHFVKGEKYIHYPAGSFPDDLKMIVVNTGIPKDTKLAVANVRKLLTSDHGSLELPIISAFTAVTKEIISLIRLYSDYTNTGTIPDTPKDVATVTDIQEFYSQFARLVRMNQNLLQIIGVSHDTIDEMALQCSRLNLAFKLTGAGCGGSCLVFPPPYYNPTTSQEAEESKIDIEDEFNIIKHIKSLHPFNQSQVNLYEVRICQPGVKVEFAPDSQKA